MSAPGGGADDSGQGLTALVRKLAADGNAKLTILDVIEGHQSNNGEREAAHALLDDLIPALSIEEENEEDSPLGTEPAFPSECFSGFFADFRDWLQPTTEAPLQYQYGVALTVAGCVVGRRAAVVAPAPCFPNFYVVQVGRSTLSHKTYTANQGADLLLRLYEPDPQAASEDSPEMDVISGIRSAEGLLESLAGADKRRLLKLSEFFQLATKIEQQSGATIKPFITDLYDNPLMLNPVIKTPRGAKRIFAQRPFLAILASTTLEWLAKSFDPTDSTSGYQARFVFFHGIPTEAKALPPEPDRHRRDALLAQLNELRCLAVDLSKDADDGYARIPLAPKAAELYTKWYERIHRRLLEETAIGGLLARLPQTVHKVALLYALLDRRCHILPEDYEVAFMLAGYLEGTVHYIWSNGLLNERTQRERSIVKALREAGQPLFGRDLCRRLTMDTKQLQDIIEPMVKAEVVRKVPGARRDSWRYTLHGGIEPRRYDPTPVYTRPNTTDGVLTDTSDTLTVVREPNVERGSDRC